MARLKIYTDENVDVRVAEGLRRLGVQAVSVYEEGKDGTSDEAQLAYAATLRAVIFTHDPDLIEIAMEINHRGRRSLGRDFRRNAPVASRRVYPAAGLVWRSCGS